MARKLIIHHHLFKNAGTSVDRALQQSFGHGWANYDSDDPAARMTFDDVRPFLAERGDLRALSSHHLLPLSASTKPENGSPAGHVEGFDILPLVVLREPISRARSAYLFEWAKQPGLDEPRGPLAEYVREKLDQGRHSVIADFQVVRLSELAFRQRAATRPGPTDLGPEEERRIRLELAKDYLSELPVFGLVEEFAASIELFNQELARFDPTVDRLRPHQANVLQGTDVDLDEIHRGMREEMGDGLYEELVDRNRGDRELYRWAAAEFRRRAEDLVITADESEPASAPTPTADLTPTADRAANAGRWFGGESAEPLIDVTASDPSVEVDGARARPIPPGGRCLIVVGMHRSGTSALAGSLQSAGVDLGDVVTFSADNLRGNRENRDVLVLHDDLLQANGGSWSSPVAPLEWQRIHLHFRDLFIRQFADSPIWGFKDPRTLLALQGWLKARPDAEVVGIFRHPFLVAQSLQIRDGLEPEQGLDLWLFYNRVLLWWHDRLTGEGRPFPVIEFDRDGARFTESLEQLVTDLALPGPHAGFFDPSLRSAETPRYEDVPGAGDALRVYDRLCALAGRRSTANLS